MSNAKVKFDKTIARCNEMVALYNKLKSDCDIVSQDILRGAIVLSVAAFDAYATDCFSEHFVEYIKKNRVDDSLIELLTLAGFDVKFALDLLNADRPYRKIRTLIDRYYSKYTTQKMNVIDDLFRLYHLNCITKCAAKKSGKNPEVLIKSVEKLIGRRHSIVHDGDYNEHSRITAVSESDIKKIRSLEILVSNMEDIINNKFLRCK